MAEELINNLGYDGATMRPQALWAHDTPQAIAAQVQSATKCQKLSNAFSPEIASCIWVRFTLKINSPNLAKKKWKTF